MLTPSTSTMVSTPNTSTMRIIPSGSSINDEINRKSVETVTRSRSPMISSKKLAAKRPKNLQIQGLDAHSDDTDRDDTASYFDHSPAPSQFLGNRQRPLSFYDMKEQQKQARPGGPTQSQRNSWRGSGEMPYNYADIIGDNRLGYAPPKLGRRTRTQPREAASPPVTSDIYLGLPWTMWMNSEVKNMFVASVGEWVGTTMFLFFAFAGTQVANAHSQAPAESTTTNATVGFSPIVMLYIAISFGFSLMVNVWIFFRISGGLFNPAVTLALWATGAVGSTRAICLFFSQIVGSITASALVLAMFPTPLNVRTTLSEGTSLAQGVFIEALMTSELVFTILMLAIEKHKSTFIAPVGIGLALFVAELVGVYYTGGSLNPARSLGPCIITNLYDAEHWIYWVGPGLGSILAVGFYKFIKMLEYEMANPGQDGDEHNDPTKNPNHEVREKQRTSTARVLQALGYPTMAHEEAQANPDTLRQAEEGTHCGHCSRPVSMLDTADDLEQPMHSGLALSTVASMSDAHQSPVRQIYSPSRGGFPSEKRTNVRSS